MIKIAKAFPTIKVVLCSTIVTSNNICPSFISPPKVVAAINNNKINGIVNITVKLHILVANVIRSNLVPIKTIFHLKYAPIPYNKGKRFKHSKETKYFFL